MLFEAVNRFSQLQHEQWLPAEELARRQAIRLQRIVQHAYRSTRYYRETFAEEGVRPEEIRSPEDLARLPLLDRRGLRALGEEVSARHSGRSKLHSSFTSGSTGEGAHSYFDSSAWLLGKYLIKLRARWACGVRPWDRIAQFQWIPNADTPFRRHVLRQKSFGIDRPFTDVLRDVYRYAPTVLYGFPGYLRKLSEASRGELNARLVFTSGEMLGSGTRTALEESIGATVYDIYGCTEMKEIAWECPERNGYHVNADWLVVETLSKPAGEAPAGSVVVTSLYNEAMPLIRYVVGDLGRLLDRPCACGRTLPLMAPDEGRWVDYFVLRDGREVSPYTVMTPVEALEGVAQFEILQEEVDFILVRIIPSPSWGESTRRTILRSLGEILPGARIEIALVEAIQRERTGKYRIVQSKVSRSSK